MSLTVFLALCILGVDSLIYILFKWTYGDKRDALKRQLAEHKNALKELPPRPFLVASRQSAPRSQEPWHTGPGQYHSRPRAARLAVDME